MRSTHFSFLQKLRHAANRIFLYVAVESERTGASRSPDEGCFFRLWPFRPMWQSRFRKRNRDAPSYSPQATEGIWPRSPKNSRYSSPTALIPSEVTIEKRFLSRRALTSSCWPDACGRLHGKYPTGLLLTRRPRQGEDGGAHTHRARKMFRQ
jgi:hypothetical protein